jgi:ceramide glucosyltransferase
MISGLQTIGLLAGLVAVLGSVYCLAEAFVVLRLMRLKKVRTAVLVATECGTKLLTLSPHTCANDNGQAITIFKPLYSASPGLRADLETLFSQDYGGPVQIIFGLHRDSDPAKAIVNQVREEHPHSDITVVVSPKTHGANAKISNLLNMHLHARHPIFVICDGDIAVPSDWLSTLTRTLDAPGIGLVSCLYRGVPERPLFWPIISAMGMSYSFLPNVMLAAATGLEVPCLGATIAIRQSTLAAVGGFGRFADTLADDYYLGSAVRAKGLGVALSTSLVRHNAGEKSLTEFFDHELRWARTIRMINPVGYAMSLVTHNVGVAALGVLFGPTEFGFAVLASAVGSRIALQWVIDKSFACWSGPICLLPIRDLLSCAVFILSFLSRKVRWGERVFDARPRCDSNLESAAAAVSQPNLETAVPFAKGSVPNL